RGRSAGLRRQDGHRRDAQVGERRLYALVARAHQDDRSRRRPRRRYLEEALVKAATDAAEGIFSGKRLGAPDSRPSATCRARPRRPLRSRWTDASSVAQWPIARAEEPSAFRVARRRAG